MLVGKVRAAGEDQGRPARGAVTLPTVQQERSASEVVETFWKGLSLAEKDQLHTVSDAGLWVSSGLRVAGDTEVVCVNRRAIAGSARS